MITKELQQYIMDTSPPSTVYLFAYEMCFSNAWPSKIATERAFLPQLGQTPPLCPSRSQVFLPTMQVVSSTCYGTEQKYPCPNRARCLPPGRAFIPCNPARTWASNRAAAAYPTPRAQFPSGFFRSFADSLTLQRVSSTRYRLAKASRQSCRLLPPLSLLRL